MNKLRDIDVVLFLECYFFLRNKNFKSQRQFLIFCLFYSRVGLLVNVIFVFIQFMLQFIVFWYVVFSLGSLIIYFVLLYWMFFLFLSIYIFCVILFFFFLKWFYFSIFYLNIVQIKYFFFFLVDINEDFYGCLKQNRVLKFRDE